MKQLNQSVSYLEIITEPIGMESHLSIWRHWGRRVRARWRQSMGKEACWGLRLIHSGRSNEGRANSVYTCRMKLEDRDSKHQRQTLKIQASQAEKWLKSAIVQKGVQVANPKGTTQILLAPNQESEVHVFSLKVTAYKRSYPNMHWLHQPNWTRQYFRMSKLLQTKKNKSNS